MIDNEANASIDQTWITVSFCCKDEQHQTVLFIAEIGNKLAHKTEKQSDTKFESIS